MAHETRAVFMAEMASQTDAEERLVEEEKRPPGKDQCGEKFSPGFTDHTSWWVKIIQIRLEFGRSYR